MRKVGAWEDNNQIELVAEFFIDCLCSKLHRFHLAVLVILVRVSQRLVDLGGGEGDQCVVQHGDCIPSKKRIFSCAAVRIKDETLLACVALQAICRALAAVSHLTSRELAHLPAQVIDANVRVLSASATAFAVVVAWPVGVDTRTTPSGSEVAVSFDELRGGNFPHQIRQATGRFGHDPVGLGVFIVSEDHRENHRERGADQEKSHCARSL